MWPAVHILTVPVVICSVSFTVGSFDSGVAIVNCPKSIFAQNTFGKTVPSHGR